VADGWGRAVRGERGTREMGRVGHEVGEERGRAFGRGKKAWAGSGPAERGEKGFSFFLFLFLFYFFFLNPFFFSKQIFI
jgi:hypothetical protein